MLHIDHPSVRNRIFSCGVGLEKENLRVTTEGRMSHIPHPFPMEKHIVRDFCENQVEINTEVAASPEEAVRLLSEYDRHVKAVLSSLPEKELLWPFSNPPLIRNTEDIPIAQFYESESEKTQYREYLSDRYGRYKMTFCGIHYNYSFGDDLLREDFSISGFSDFREYKDHLYLKLARACAVYSWVIVAITAASPLHDGSFVRKDGAYKTVFNGMASSRCSELGYWNYFTPVMNYKTVKDYVKSIQDYVDMGLLKYPSELYYPIRLKPRGSYDLERLLKEGVDHIELRMIDLNPLTEVGIDIRDARFIQLFLIWAASIPEGPWDIAEQVYSTQNFKNASHFDLKTVRIILPKGLLKQDTPEEGLQTVSLAGAGLKVLEAIEEFYSGYPEDVLEVIRYEKEKFIDIEKRYSWKILKEYGDDYVRKGLERAGNV